MEKVNKITACLVANGATTISWMNTLCDLDTQQLVNIIQERFKGLEMNISWIKWNGKIVLDNRDKPKSTVSTGGSK